MQAIQAFVRQAMTYINSTPDQDTKVSLIKTLLAVTEGKVSRLQGNVVHGAQSGANLAWFHSMKPSVEGRLRRLMFEHADSLPYRFFFNTLHYAC